MSVGPKCVSLSWNFNSVGQPFSSFVAWITHGNKLQADSFIWQHHNTSIPSCPRSKSWSTTKTFFLPTTVRPLSITHTCHSLEKNPERFYFCFCFPQLLDHEFQRTFPGISRHIYRQLLRIFAHIYHAHFHQILHLRAEPHFNSLFAHFLAFGQEFDLLELKEIKGEPGQVVGVGLLWEKWRELGTLEKWFLRDFWIYLIPPSDGYLGNLWIELLHRTIRKEIVWFLQ